jgi:hypothetical protein
MAIVYLKVFKFFRRSYFVTKVSRIYDGYCVSQKIYGRQIPSFQIVF